MVLNLTIILRCGESSAQRTEKKFDQVVRCSKLTNERSRSEKQARKKGVRVEAERELCGSRPR